MLKSSLASRFFMGGADRFALNTSKWLSVAHLFFEKSTECALTTACYEYLSSFWLS